MNMFGKIMHTMFFSCLKATELLEKGIHVKLSVSDRIRLYVHKKMCVACSRYEKQSILLEKGIDLNSKIDFDANEIRLLKESIIEQLERG